jgi:hypothetical protein
VPVPPVTRLLGRRAGPIGIALTAYDLWRRLPEKQRRQLLQQGRKHGTRIATTAAKRSATQLKKRLK